MQLDNFLIKLFFIPPLEIMGMQRWLLTYSFPIWYSLNILELQLMAFPYHRSTISKVVEEVMILLRVLLQLPVPRFQLWSKWKILLWLNPSFTDVLVWSNLIKWHYCRRVFFYSGQSEIWFFFISCALCNYYLLYTFRNGSQESWLGKQVLLSPRFDFCPINGL